MLYAFWALILLTAIFEIPFSIFTLSEMHLTLTKLKTKKYFRLLYNAKLTLNVLEGRNYYGRQNSVSCCHNGSVSTSSWSLCCTRGFWVEDWSSKLRPMHEYRTRVSFSVPDFMLPFPPPALVVPADSRWAHITGRTWREMTCGLRAYTPGTMSRKVITNKHWNCTENKKFFTKINHTSEVHI